jgi:hypothetical protein
MVRSRFANTRATVTLGGLVLLLGAAWTSSLAGKDAYANGGLGFTMAPPAFTVPTDVQVATLARFYAPPANGFADNLGVELHRTTLADLCKTSDEQFKTNGFTVVTSKDVKVGGADAHEYHCRGHLNNFDLEFLVVAVASGKNTYLLTATTLASDFAKVEPTFRAAIESFKIGQ